MPADTQVGAGPTPTMQSSSSAAASQRRRVARELEQRRREVEARELQEQWEQQQRRAWECYSSAAKLKATRPHSAGPRTKYRGMQQVVGHGNRHRRRRRKQREDEMNTPLARTIVERGAFTGFHHKTNHTNGEHNGKLHYRVCLPQEYQAKGFVHFSRRPRKEYATLRRQRSRRNSFFSNDRPLSPTPSALTRQTNPNANLKVNFGSLMQDMLDHDVQKDGNNESLSCGDSREDQPNPKTVTLDTDQPYYMSQSPSRSVLEIRSVASNRSGSRPSSPLHRTMSSHEISHIRPLAEDMRRRSIALEHVIDGDMGTRKRRPLSASASRRLTGPAEALRGSPKFWAPQHHHPQILGNMDIPTSKGRRRVSRVLRHVPANKALKNKARHIARGVVMRHPVLSPVSTRSGPSLPVRWW
eukprot:g4167.t1